LSYPAAAAVQLAVTVPVIAAACWAVRRTTDPCRRAFVLASAAPLATPYAFNYDLPMLVPILVWALFGRLPWRPERSAVYLLAWIVPVGLMYANMLGLGVCSLVLILFFVASLQEAVADPAPAGSGVPQRPAAAWPRPLEA
jgi:hypothetical protein